jgi:hypothetical protein
MDFGDIQNDRRCRPSRSGDNRFQKGEIHDIKSPDGISFLIRFA